VRDSIRRFQSNFRWVKDALNRNSFSWQIAAVTLALLTILTALVDPTRRQGDGAAWLLVALTSACTAFLTYLFLGLLVRRTQDSWFKISLTLGSFFLVGACRGITIGVGSIVLGLADSIDFGFRLIGGGFAGLILLLLTTLLVSDGVDYKRRLNELDEERRALIGLNLEFDTPQTNSERFSIGYLNQRIGEALRKLESLSVASKAEALHAAQTLLEISERLIRPLSQELKQLVEDADVRSKTRVYSWSVIGSLLAAVTPFQPLNLALIWLVVGAVTTSALGAGLAGLTALSLFVGTTFGLSALVQRIYNLRSHRIPSAFRLPFVLFCYCSISILASFISYIPLRDFENPSFPNLHLVLLVVDPLLLLITQVLLATVAAVKFRRNRLMEALSYSNYKVRWMLSRKKMLARSLADRMAHQIHSEVQGSLVALALQLRRLADLDDESAIQKEDWKDKVFRSVFLQQHSNSHPLVSDALDNLAEKWRGIIHVETKLEETVARAIDGDPSLACCITDLLDDAVTNSAKHAGAKNVSIEVSIQREDLLEIRICDDGSPSKIAPIGGGMTLLAELAVDYSLALSELGAVLKASFALQSTSEEEK